MIKFKNKLIILLIFLIPLFCFGQKINTTNTIIKIGNKLSHKTETTEIILKKNRIIFKNKNRMRMVFIFKGLHEMYGERNILVKNYYTNHHGIIISIIKKQSAIVGVMIINIREDYYYYKKDNIFKT